MDFITALMENTTLAKLVSSVLLLVAISLAYRLVSTSIRRMRWANPDVRRRWLVMARNTAVLIALIALVVVWAEQLRTLALSLVGFAVAIVLVTRELAMCLTGGMMRTSASLFDVGDRIEVKKLRGDVIDLNMLTTTILEIGLEYLTHMYTGRAVVIPNSMFLTEPVVNESFTRNYVLQTTEVPINRREDWARAERHLLSAAHEACGDFMEAAQNHIQRVTRQQGIDVPPVDPRVTLQFPGPEQINLILRFPAPARLKNRTEQAILRRYLELDAAAALEHANADG